MSRSLNRVMIIGNMTQDPEVRQTPNGQNVCTIGVATNRSWKDTAGALQEKVEFHSVVMWGKLAEIAGQYLRKGKQVYIEGRLETRSWEAQDGQKRYRTEIIAESMLMLGNKGPGDSSSSAEFMPPAQASATIKTAPIGKDEVRIEDIPF